MKKLKKYKLKINPNKGLLVSAIAQVENPAIEQDFLKFNRMERLQMNEDKMELFGPLLIPNQEIYRYSEKMGEYMIEFDEETIKEIAMEFMKNGFHHNINLDHSNKDAKSFVFESFVSSELVPNPEAYSHLPLGTWFVRMKVMDEGVWNDIKSGKRKGFSIEGLFEYVDADLEKQFSKTTNNKNKVYTMLKDMFRKIFQELSQELETNETQEVENETPIETPIETPTEVIETEMEASAVSSESYKIEERKVGAKVEVIDANGELANAPDGEYTFEDGFTFTVKDGVISEIAGEAPVEEEASMPEEEDKPEEEEKPEEEKAEVDYQAQIDDLKKQLEEIKSMISGVPSEEEMKSQMEEIKKEFKSVFDKFTQIPAQPSPVAKNVLAREEARRKFEEFVIGLRK